MLSVIPILALKNRGIQYTFHNEYIFDMLSFHKSLENWVNEDGYIISSHVIILPAVTRRDQIDVGVWPRIFKMAKVMYVWPQVIFNQRFVR